MTFPKFKFVLLAITLSITSFQAHPAEAGSVSDCISLLNNVGSAASRVRDWNGTRGVTLSALGSNDKAIERVTNDLNQLRSSYAKAITCAKSDEARKSPSYAQARSRFNRDFPKYHKAIIAAEKEAKLFAAAISTDNITKGVMRRLHKSAASDYEAQRNHVTETIARLPTLAGANHYLDATWQRQVKADIQQRLQRLKAKKGTVDTKAIQDTLRTGAVVRRLSGFTRDDAMDPRKVANAFASSSHDLLAALPTNSTNFVLGRYAPVESVHPKKSRLGMQYPGDVKPTTPAFVFYNQKVIFVRYQKDELPKMHTPIVGLVWDVNKEGEVLFVSSSGGRYLSRIHQVIPAANLSVPLAQGIVNRALAHDDVVALSGRGILNARYGRTMEKAKDGYKACAATIWKSNEGAFSRIKNANILREARQARMRTLDGKVRKGVDRKCKSHHQKYKSAWEGAMREYKALREQTLAASAVIVSKLESK